MPHKGHTAKLDSVQQELLDSMFPREEISPFFKPLLTEVMANPKPKPKPDPKPYKAREKIKV